MPVLQPRFAVLLSVAILAGCGGSGSRRGASDRAGRYEGDYTGSYTLASNATGTPDGAIVLDVGSSGDTEGSLTVSGTVYTFTGRIVNGGSLTARGDGIFLLSQLVRSDVGTTRTLSGTISLSGTVNFTDAQVSLTRVAATN